ncbi:hypothetical protein MMC30_001712 [Trapelia coarctata]|nr:hypothetical protein [Trapelia coarctata]
MPPTLSSLSSTLSTSLPSWSQTKKTSKSAFDKSCCLIDKLGAPANRLSNRLGSEAFWPTSLDKESEKAARILRSFCKDGFYSDVETPSTDPNASHISVGADLPAATQSTRKSDTPRGKQRIVKKIPTSVIRNAKGLAIFTTCRSGLWVSGAGGSGVLVARTATGDWSPPSGILLHTAGLGFLAGIDIYDCVVVINTASALEAFTKLRCTLGGEVSAVAGPVGVGGILESEIHKRQAPVWTYLKSRGFYAGVQVDGTVVIERTDENERFYGERIGVGDILKGKARMVPKEVGVLINTLRMAQGEKVDEEKLAEGITEGDLEAKEIEEEDPDPFGVRALEEVGVEIKEAGTGQRPSMDDFEIRPLPKRDAFRTSNEDSKGTQTPPSLMSKGMVEGIQPEETGVTAQEGHLSPVAMQTIRTDSISESISAEKPHGASTNATEQEDSGSLAGGNTCIVAVGSRPVPQGD